jgi:hypothetical protein
MVMFDAKLHLRSYELIHLLGYPGILKNKLRFNLGDTCNMEGSNNLLQNLPSRGLCAKASVSSRVRTASAPLYLPTHDTSPPPDQFITTDKTSKLLRRFHEIIAERESRQGKRCHSDLLAPSRERERQRQKI